MDILEMEIINDDGSFESEIDFSGEYVSGATGEEYQKGYNEGYAKAESENPFYYATRLDNVMGGATFPENYEAVIKLKKAPKVCNYIFNNCSRGLKSVKMISEDQSNVVEFVSSLNLSDTGRATLEVVDLSEFNKKFSTLNMAFRYQAKLKSILGALDLSECTNTTNAFLGCNALEDIEFVPNTIKININFAYSNNLTAKSIQSIIDGLATVETAQTLDFHADIVAKLTEEQWVQITDKNWSVL